MRKILRFLMAAMPVFTALVGLASAQQTRTPMLIVPPEEKATSLKLSAVKIEAQIFGFLSETKMTMTFYNPNDRVLAGDLNFPLPEGATVSGYALDVDGVMVDGVVVEKDKGRQVYEKIVRQGIDPGLVEQVKGNNFKTRVFPIRPRGSRTIMVKYLSELVHDPKGTGYHLPLSFKDPVEEFSLRVEVVKPAVKPVIKQGNLANFSFEKWRDSYVADIVLKNEPITKDLVIALPDIERQKVLVEKDVDNRYHFVINDFPKLPDSGQTKVERKSPGRIVIFWDASGSSEKTDHKRELKLLENYLTRQGAKKVDVDVVLFRNEAEEAERFVIEKGNSEKLIAALSTVGYDGGTQMGCLSPNASSEAPDFYMLFSDGLSNFGKEETTGFKAPIYAISADSAANHSFLRYLALQTGGEYFNLNRLDDETVLSRIGTSPYSFISASSETGGIDDIYPKVSQPVYGRFALAGKFEAEKTKITLNYGIQGKVLNKVEYEISRSDAVDGTLLRLFCAQKKIEDLQVFPKRNEKELIAIGKEHGLVTPGTSLIVLEGLQQYVEHKIAPPTTLPDMRTAYFARINDNQRKEQRRVADKLEQVVAMWQKRVDWWNTEFKQPKDLKHKPAPDGETSRPRGAVPPGGSVQGFRTGRLDQPGRAEQMTPQRNLATGYSDSPAEARQPAVMDEARAKRPEEAVLGEDTIAPSKTPQAVADTEPEVGAPAGSSEAERAAKRESDKRGELSPHPEGSISLKPWDPSTPYLAELKAAKPETYLNVYMGQRKTYAASPAFFLDCADFFFKQKQDVLAVRVLSNIAELELENPHLLRVLGRRLAQESLQEPARTVFEEVLRLRPEEPQSYRDLALTLDSLEQYDRAMELLYLVVTTTWDRFPEIEVVALMELNRTIARAKRAGIKDFPVDPRLIKLLDVDVRIVLTWDADMTDVDLWVIEPSGEKAFYQHSLTSVGGLVSRDVTDGYGPEEYVLKKAPKGQYKVQANYYGSGAPTLTGAVTLKVDVFTRYGRPDEKRRSITLRLKHPQDVVSVGEIEFQ